MADVKVFVAARGNEFMKEIAGWLAEAATISGRSARVIENGLPRADGSINLVVAPHEFFELYPANRRRLQGAAVASICVNTEQPGTPWFKLTVDVCRRGLMTLDISELGEAALRAAGVNAVRVRLGGVPSMRPATPAAGDRPIDVLFMGGLDDRRGAALADLAQHLWWRNADIRVVRVDRPLATTTPNTVFGAAKYDLLSSAKVLLNLHRGRSGESDGGGAHAPYFEWARAVEAMARGCVVLSEPSHGSGPLVAGAHFVETPVNDMPAAIHKLLADESLRAEIAGRAHHVLFDDLALVNSLAPVLDHIEAEILPRVAVHASSRSGSVGAWRLGMSQGPHPVRLGPFRPFLPALTAAKRIAMAENAALQRLDAAACELRHGSHQHVVRRSTPAYAAATPEVSVVVSLYNYADVVKETLSSIAASEDIAFEVIVVEDHATDSSSEVVRQFLDQHPDVPMTLLAKEANEGLAAARNDGFREARADLVMVMDADNLIYPSCLRKLADALGAHPEVDAAYAILEDFGDQRNIRSAFAWDVERLCEANYIDAQSMMRKSAWERLGGYRADDDLVYGWEDWDLWLRLAAEGGKAMLVAQILGRYRVQRGSMIALTNLATDETIAAIRERYPTLPWPKIIDGLAGRPVGTLSPA